MRDAVLETEHQDDECHARVHAEACLAEVRGARVGLLGADGQHGAHAALLRRAQLHALGPIAVVQGDAVVRAAEQDQVPDPAAAHAGLLRLGLTLGEARQAARIADGAIVMDKPEPYISLEGEGEDVRVHITPAPPTPKSSLLVAETMIAASAAVARWGGERGIPLLHRTQDVPLPGEYAGVWTAPQDMARIMRALIPSSLEVQPRRHAALAMDAYAPVTSPLRRYSDLVNEAQVVHFLTGRQPRWDRAELASLLNSLSPVLEAVGQVQRFRPRYWKLLYFRQQGDKMWWPGVITEENDAFVSVSLPEQALFVRGRRQLFDERACPGMEVMVRLGKINPLWNEVQIMDVAPAEQA